MKGRILAVDPGEKRLGIAISDPTQTIANPFTVIQYVSREQNATKIVSLAKEQEAIEIVVGHPLNSDGLPGPSARFAERLAEVIQSKTDLPVILWDESGSTKGARTARIAMGVPRKKRKGHLDDIAATIILQSYLDAKQPV